MTRGARVVPLSDNYTNAVLAITTGILPKEGGLEDQAADFVDDMRFVREEMNRMTKEAMEKRHA